MIKGTIKGKFDPPNVDLTPQLSLIAERVVIPEIAAKIQAGENIKGKEYPPLDPKTVAQKRRVRTAQHPEQQLIETGELFRSFKYRKSGKSVIVYISMIRRQIAEYLQVEGVRSKKYGRRRFNFFGTNDSMAEKAYKIMGRELEKRLKIYGSRSR